MMSNNIKAMYILWNYLGKMPTPDAAHRRALALFDIEPDETMRDIKCPMFPQIKNQLYTFTLEDSIQSTGLTYHIKEDKFHLTFGEIKKEFSEYVANNYPDDIIMELEPIWKREKDKENERQKAQWIIDSRENQKRKELEKAERKNAQPLKEDFRICIPFYPKTEIQKLKFKSLADLLAIFTNQHNMQPGMRNKNKCFAWFLLIYFGSINLDYVNEGITAEDFVRTWSIKFEDLWATLMRNKWNGGAAGGSGRRRFGGGGANYQTRQEFEEDIHIIKWDVNNPKFNIDTVEPKSPVRPSRLR